MSSKLLPQVELGPRIGGIKELSTRLSFYNGTFQSLVLAAIFYGGDPAIPHTGLTLQQVVPSVFLFYGVLGVVAALVGLWEHSVMVPAQAQYNQQQQFQGQRSPIMREVERLHERLDELEGSDETAKKQTIEG